MHIKRLEIAGFKSFVDRTVIHFDHDVIGIVGPNGCGKSNIVDAIRWCLGEQSARHLRGRAMEDVIFNGSESRSPAGLAEATITFDNTNPEYAATLPLEFREYPEIAVTRRLFRDGTSEYLINKTQVRLRDVTELFLGTGVGTKAYSIVEQERIGQVVSARPEDRRLFLEEAAGITKYKQRRKQAERKMELTRQNLLRINDIVSEIDRGRAALKRQVAKAERFIEYRRELDDLVLHEASHRLLELIVVGRVEREAYQNESGAAENLRQTLGEAEAGLEEARREAQGIEDRNEQASRLAFEADNTVSALHAEIERSSDRMSHLSERLEAARTERDGLEERRTTLRAELDGSEQQLGSLSQEERERESDALRETETLSSLQSSEAEANESVLGLRRRSGELGAQAAALDAHLAGIATRVADARNRRDRSSQEGEKLSGELADLIAKKGALEHSVAQLAEGKLLTVAERETLTEELQSLSGRQRDSERAVDALKNEIGLRRNRLRVLQDLHRRLEGVGAGARALLSKPNAPVLGMVADRLEVPEALTQAVAGLLGSRLQAVIVPDQAQGLALLEALAQGEQGRADVIAERPPFTAGVSRSFGEDPRVLGRLLDRLEYSDSDEPLLCALLGDAVLVETAQDSVWVARQYPGVTAVSFDGTVARPDGTMSGGAGDGIASGMLEQKREMHQLSSELERLDAEAARLLAEHNATRARVIEVSTALDQARQSAHEGELAHVTAEKDLLRNASEMTRVQARLATLEAEIAEIDRSLQSVAQNEGELRSQLDRVRTELGQQEHALQRAEESAADWRERVAAQASLVTERRVRLAQVKEQLQSARAARTRVESLLLEIQTRSERLGCELEETATAYGETAARILTARESRLSASESARQAHSALDMARLELERVRQALSAEESALRQLRESLAVHDATAKKHELAVQRLDLEREHLENGVRERFRGLELAKVVGDYHSRAAPDSEHRRRIEELTQLIDRMGPVNLDAKAEHESAEKRFKELNDQKLDIEKALEELDQAIRHMNRESRRRFRETFDQVNALFKRTFSRLFRGGRAELQLTDPEDLLGSGVEIVAQPPGKKVGTIDLLSGGEKALTAVSLIFAIFQHRPSPFCILDEVDAPLDEANVGRYNELVASMTSHSQFILITHIKKTMQSVDVLYGVTMGEPGVSRIVSVKVNENAQVRSDSIVVRANNRPGTAEESGSAALGVA